MAVRLESLTYEVGGSLTIRMFEERATFDSQLKIDPAIDPPRRIPSLGGVLKLRLFLMSNYMAFLVSTGKPFRRTREFCVFRWAS